MAAPSGIKWGSIVGGYGRIGIYTNVSSTNTQTSIDVEVWFWSKYSVSDSNNSYYYNNLASTGSATTKIGSVNINTTVASGDGWSTSNQVKLGSSSYTYNHGTSASTRYFYAKLADVDRVGGTMTVSTSVAIRKLASYTVTYNANGGSGAPGSSTKWYGKTLVLATAKPTRNGYTFKGWATSSTGSVAYASGANYTANSAVTLYAVWEPHTYKVTYYGNGGSNTPNAQTKKHGTDILITTDIPIRTNYKFLGWSTSADSNVVAYKPRDHYSTNASISLWAVWELAYTAPRIVNVIIERSPNFIEYARISFEYECDMTPTAISIDCKESGPTDWTIMTYDTTERIQAITNKYTGKGGVVDLIDYDVIGFLQDKTYDIRITVEDENGWPTVVYGTLPSIVYPIDFLAGGKGVAFGKAAETEDLAEFEFDAQFNGAVCGNVMGLNKLPQIPAGSNLNDYMATGSYAVYKNTDATDISNIPVARAGRLEVNSSTGEGVRSEQWSYIRQKYIPYNIENATWERDITRSENNVWTYGEWYRTSLNKGLSEKLHGGVQKVLWGDDLTGGMYMTAEHTINLSEAVSSQLHGIVLVFCYYNGIDDTNFSWQSFFVPKALVALSSSGHTFTLNRGKYSYIGTKYLYIYDTQIKGHADNEATGTANGITYANNKFVLRYVIGI